MKKNRIFILLICSFIVFSGICYSCSYGKTDTITNLDDGADKAMNEALQSSGNEDLQSETLVEYGTKEKILPLEKVMVKVHICGAVNQPGVYEVEGTARLVDLIHLAEGLTDTAAGDYINQAMYISDGLRIYIPTLDEVKDQDIFSDFTMITEDNTGGQKGADHQGLININQATEQELMSLPGIGAAKSKKIVAYRDANGAFQSIEDLMKIPGIKEGLFNQIASLITVK